MCSRIQLGSIEKGSLRSKLDGNHTLQPAHRDFPYMNIAPDLYRAQRHRIERRFRKTRDLIEATRCRILLLLNSGCSARSTSQLVGCA
jgi:hypothetical protein